jgi:hypothetical protein
MVSSDGGRLIRRSGNRLADQITRQVNEPSQQTSARSNAKPVPTFADRAPEMKCAASPGGTFELILLLAVVPVNNAALP